MADDFSYKTWFTLDNGERWFQMNVLMPGGYEPSMKRKIENWHDHRLLIIDIRKEGGMTVKVPVTTSDGADNRAGAHKMADYSYGEFGNQGSGFCYVKFETWNARSYSSQKLLFTKLDIYRLHPQRYVFSLAAGKIINVQSPEETLTLPAETVIVE